MSIKETGDFFNKFKTDLNTFENKTATIIEETKLREKQEIEFGNEIKKDLNELGILDIFEELIEKNIFTVKDELGHAKIHIGKFGYSLRVSEYKGKYYDDDDHIFTEDIAVLIDDEGKYCVRHCSNKTSYWPEKKIERSEVLNTLSHFVAVCKHNQNVPPNLQQNYL